MSITPSLRTLPAARVRATGLALVTMALLMAPLPALADPWWGSHFWSDRTASGDLVDVQLLVQGHAAPLFLNRDARDRFYVQAFKGRNYSLSLRNRTAQRIGVLIAVDGLNVVNGQRSSLAAGEPMYVLGPYESAVIRGWRTSMSEVRQFVFVDEERSYAERTDQANGDMGWIRVLAFRENQPQVWYEKPMLKDDRANQGQAERRADQAPAPPSAGGQPTAPKPEARDESRAYNEPAPSAKESFPGTGWGDRRDDPVRWVHFIAERVATDHLVLRYEYEDGLRALGIFPERANRLWERDHGQLGFAQPPRW
jgi:hypothetical protein